MAKQTRQDETLASGGAAACDELVKRTKAEPGAPFSAVAELAALKKANRAVFETLRNRLKEAGCRVTQLDGLIADENGEKQGRSPTHADILVNLAEVAELFHTPDEIGFADLEIGDHRETWPIKSRGFRRWLQRRFFDETGGAPTNEAMAAAIGLIEAKAIHAATVRTMHVRVGNLDGKLYLDLCDAAWRSVEIDMAGWRVVERPAVRFRRSPDMRALPEPKRNGSVEDLRKLLNIAHDNDNDFVLAVAYLEACLKENGPYPIMVVTGEQGTAKSTRSALLSSVVDPRHPRLRGLPRDERDLFVAARTRHVLAFDNLSGIPALQSDALCRIASGAGFGTRANYTDDEEVLFDGARPIILNGIEDIVSRPDLAERSIFSTCELIVDEDRLSEAEVWRAFDAAHPSILGALLDAVSTGLRNEANVRPPNLPRMADFAHWAIACEQALWEDGAFLRAYHANISAAVESIIEANPVALAVRDHMAARTYWKGTAAELLHQLNLSVDDRILRSDAWPKLPHFLSGRLRRAASFLRRAGINVADTREGKQGTRMIRLTRTRDGGAAEPSNSASAASAEPLDEGVTFDTLNDSTDLVADAADTELFYSSDREHGYVPPPPPADATDAVSRPSSPSPYAVSGPAGLQKCAICNRSGGAKRIRLNGSERVWHPACADRYVAAMPTGGPEDIIAKTRAAGGVIVRPNGAGMFNPDLTRVTDPAISAALLDAITANPDAILEALDREAAK
jgi:hypothetical protein